MAIWKYAGDYRIEYNLTDTGKTQPRRVYRGRQYGFLKDPRPLVWQIAAAEGLIIVLLLPLFCSNTPLGRKLPVILPAGMAVLPIYLLLAAACRIAAGPGPFTREHRDKTQYRFYKGAVGQFVLLLTACVGCPLDPQPPVVCLYVTLLPAAFLLTRWNRLKTQETQVQNNTAWEENHENA